jgi:hypothetical protein
MKKKTHKKRVQIKRRRMSRSKIWRGGKDPLLIGMSSVVQAPNLGNLGAKLSSPVIQAPNLGNLGAKLSSTSEMPVIQAPNLGNLDTNLSSTPELPSINPEQLKALIKKNLVEHATDSTAGFTEHIKNDMNDSVKMATGKGSNFLYDFIPGINEITAISDLFDSASGQIKRVQEASKQMTDLKTKIESNFTIEPIIKKLQDQMPGASPDQIRKAFESINKTELLSDVIQGIESDLQDTAVSTVKKSFVKNIPGAQTWQLIFSFFGKTGSFTAHQKAELKCNDEGKDIKNREQCPEAFKGGGKKGPCCMDRIKHSRKQFKESNSLFSV